MTTIQTEALQAKTLSVLDNDQVYCGLDSAVALEVREKMQEEFHAELSTDNGRARIYSFERALQAPYLEIMLRGWRVDELARRRAAQGLRERHERLRQVFARLVEGVVDNPLYDTSKTHNSHKQLKAIFYEELLLPEVVTYKKGEKKLSMDREALEKLETYIYARPLVSLILSLRDIESQLEVLESEISPDGRFRASYNIAGTECIAGDSLVWTKGGLRAIKEIYETPHSVAIWNGEDYITPIKKVKYKDRIGKKITLENGYELKCSDNHPLLTKRGFIKANEITISDSIQINLGLPELFGQHALPRWSFISLLSEDLCELFGMMLADGSLNNNTKYRRCRLSNSNPRVRDRFLILAKNVFAVSGGQSGDEAYFSSGPVANWFSSIGFPADQGLGTAQVKIIPPEFLRGKPNLLRALLRGLTLDSHVTDKGIIYGTQSPVLREQIQQCLLLLGIISYKLQTGDSIRLCIPRSNCGRFMSLVGFIQEEKLIQISLIINERCQWHEPLQPMFKHFLSVRALENWSGDVYDLTMPDNSPPQYVANGMTVHNTGRSSSGKRGSATGPGGNAQNITPNLRYVFVADEGYKLFQIDAEQSEARDLGFLCGALFGDWSYLDSCESGDLHTNNCKLTWPNLAWKEPWPKTSKEDKELAENSIYYRDFSYRHLMKRGSFLSNYMGTAFTASRVLKVPLEIMEDFQRKYCRGTQAAFPMIPRFWQYCSAEIQLRSFLVNPFGQLRHFFGRASDDTTLREGIAYLPQSMTANRVNLGMWRIWKNLPQVQLLGNGYDSVIGQIKEGPEFDTTLAEAVRLMEDIPLAARGRTFRVPMEAKVGWNWSAAVNAGDIARAVARGERPPRLNPDGLVKWIPGRDTRRRLSGLERIMQ